MSGFIKRAVLSMVASRLQRVAHRRGHSPALTGLLNEVHRRLARHQQRGHHDPYAHPGYHGHYRSRGYHGHYRSRGYHGHYRSRGHHGHDKRKRW